jgi:hypothetical protein
MNRLSARLLVAAAVATGIYLLFVYTPTPRPHPAEPADPAAVAPEPEPSPTATRFYPRVVVVFDTDDRGPVPVRGVYVPPGSTGEVAEILANGRKFGHVVIRRDDEDAPDDVFHVKVKWLGPFVYIASVVDGLRIDWMAPIDQ